jgi:hypothetical protein
MFGIDDAVMLFQGMRQANPRRTAPQIPGPPAELTGPGDPEIKGAAARVPYEPQSWGPRPMKIPSWNHGWEPRPSTGWNRAGKI